MDDTRTPESHDSGRDVNGPGAADSTPPEPGSAPGSAPAPEPQPVSEPAAPAPVPEPTSAPEPEPAPAPTPAPVPEPTPAPTTEPEPAPEPEPDSSDSGGRGRGPIVAAILVILAVAIVAGALGYNALSRRLESRGDLERALELVREADDVVLAVDDIVHAQITPQLADAAMETSEQISGAQQDIDEALELIDSAYEDLNEEDQAIADALKGAASARIAMLQQAPLLVSANASAAVALEEAQVAIERMLEAEDLADQAVAKYNLQTKEGVTASTELITKALNKLNTAKERFKAAQAAFPECDMGPFVRYINAKKALLQKSKKIDETWLADELADANELVEEYNEDDKEVAELGSKLPESEVAPIQEAYDEVTGEATELYLAARAAAARADTLLRQLLGEGDASVETSPTPSETTTGTMEETGTGQ